MNDNNSAEIVIVTNDLQNACRDGDLDAAIQALNNGSDVNDYDTGEPLWLACFYGHQEIVEFLLDHGAKAEINETCALNAALSGAHVDICKLLISRAPEVLATENGPVHRHLMERAITSDNQQMILVFIEAPGVDLDFFMSHDVGFATPLQYLTDKGFLELAAMTRANLMLKPGGTRVTDLGEDPVDKLNLDGSTIFIESIGLLY